MPGVDFETDFPQPPVGPTDRSGPVGNTWPSGEAGASPSASLAGAWDRSGPGPAGRRISFANPDQHRLALTLEFPLDVEGERLDRLIIHRLTAGEMLSIVEGDDAPADDQALIRHVVAAMAGIDLEILEALSPDDAGRLAAAALPFMPAGLVGALQGPFKANGLAEAAMA